MRIAILASTLCASAILTGCGTPESVVQVPAGLPRIAMTPTLEMGAEAGVRKSLKDPNSAQFDGLVAYQQKPDIAGVCGFVNAKNSFGGYVGTTPFFVTVEMKDASGNPSNWSPGAVISDNDYIFYEMFPICGSR